MPTHGLQPISMRFRDDDGVLSLRTPGDWRAHVHESSPHAEAGGGRQRLADGLARRPGAGDVQPSQPRAVCGSQESSSRRRCLHVSAAQLAPALRLLGWSAAESWPHANVPHWLQGLARHVRLPCGRERVCIIMSSSGDAIHIASSEGRCQGRSLSQLCADSTADPSALCRSCQDAAVPRCGNAHFCFC